MSLASGMEYKDIISPPWLIPLLKADYFVPCQFHGASSKCECNMYCLDCMGNALCSYCLINHKDHRVIQVSLEVFSSIKLIDKTSYLRIFVSCRYGDLRTIMW